MTTTDIKDQIRELYDVEISAETVSNITSRIMPLVSEWQNRPLEKTYSFVFMDAIHYKVREDKQIVVKAAYVVLGVNMDGEKEVLGIWIGANESSKFWLSVLNDLKNRGVENVLILCADGLKGFKEAISAVYPFAKIQRCIVHQIRASVKYIPYKDKKAFIIGGGIGIPPMLQLAKQLKCDKQIILGYRDNQIFLADKFRKHGEQFIATEDGSVGTKGNVIDAIRENKLNADIIYACGPAPMLKAIKAYGEENQIETWISIEERMACGVGACLGCV